MANTIDVTFPDPIISDVVVDKIGPSGIGSSAWGTIAGTLANQSDLQTVLNAKVPTSTTVNGHSLTGNVSITASDVGLGNVENAAASTLYVPLVRTVNGHALSSNITITNSDIGSVPTSTTVNGHALSSNVTVTRTDLGFITDTNLSGGTLLTVATTYYDTFSSNRTLTFTGTPAAGDLPITLVANVTTSLTIGFPTSTDLTPPYSTSLTSRTYTTGVYELSWRYSNGHWIFADSFISSSGGGISGLTQHAGVYGSSTTTLASSGTLYASSYASFSVAITAISTTPATLVVDASMNVSTSVTVPANIILEFKQGGILVVAANQILTIARRPIAATSQQIFDTSASSYSAYVTISEPDGLLPLRWWGLKADNSTDDSPIFNNAVQSTNPSGGAMGQGQHFMIPDGVNIILRNTVNVFWLAGGNVPHGIGFVGEGLGSNNYQSPSTVKWDGASGGTMFEVKNEPGFYMSGFELKTDNGGNVAAIAIDLDQDDQVNCNVTTTSGQVAFTANAGLQGYANLVGRAISIPGAGAGGSTLNTTIATTTDTTHGTLAIAAGTSVSGQAVSIMSTIAGGTLTRPVIENMQFTNNPHNANLVFIRGSYYSGNNNEHYTIRHNIFNNGYNGATNSDATRGTAISFGGGGINTGSNAFNEVIENNDFGGLSIHVSTYGNVTGSIRNNLGEFANVAYSLANGAWIIERVRNENDRQFYVGGANPITFLLNDIANGTDTDNGHPLIAPVSGSVTMISNNFNGNSGTPANFIPIACTGGSSNNCSLISISNHYADSNNLLRNRKDLSTFNHYISMFDDNSVGPNTIEVGGDHNYTYPTTNLGIYNFAVQGGLNPDASSTFGNWPDGSQLYCTDAIPGSNPAIGGGNGAPIVRVNGTWVAYPITATTGGSTTISTGVGSVKMSSANAATNTSWIPIQYAGVQYYVPAWTTNSP